MTLNKAELISSLLSDKSAEIEVMKFMFASGVIHDESKLQLLEAQLNLLKDLEAANDGEA